MAITLEKLCVGCESKYDMHLVAGKGGMNNTVRWVHMVEDREVPDFLHGNELIFTTGIGHISGEDRLIKFVHHLKERNAAGVVINLGPYISYVPDYVIKYGDENDFPIFTLPWRVHIIEITYDFCSRIIENEKNEVSLADAFRKIIKNQSYIGEYRHIFDKAGFTDGNPFRIMAIEFFQNGEHTTARVVHTNREKLWRIMSVPHSPAAMYVEAGRVVLICQSCGESRIIQTFQKLEKSTLLAGITFCAGISEEGYGFDNMALLYRQAKAAATHAFIESKTLVKYCDIGIDKLICAADAFTIKSFLESTITPISEYDRKNQTDFLGILRSYIENDCSVKAVSEQMKVHRNTVNYQIAKIKEIFSLETTGVKKSSLVLAFRILKLKERGQLE